MQVTFHGQPMRLLELPMKVGTRARDVVDSTGIVTYEEIVAELTAEPDYGVAFAMFSAEIVTLKSIHE
ncbi:MAG: hypothetical protein HC840_20190 [Leptolyngbyaceae cyanobacterium RM2_2_4]|nr:hypothetical protein [Leptolyngbyaceae cyanobacterium SM1_4_3]NJO51368.1 hypothetical protein [Leptolyngbyaceae cyanobacterium RM2_2_4]